jgi:hypothetical protein
MNRSDVDCDIPKGPRDFMGREVNMHTVLVGGAMIGPTQLADLVTLDEDGVMWWLARGERPSLKRACYANFIRWHPDLASLCQSLKAGHCVGLLSEIAPVYATLWEGPTGPDPARGSKRSPFLDL